MAAIMMTLVALTILVYAAEAIGTAWNAGLKLAAKGFTAMGIDE